MSSYNALRHRATALLLLLLDALLLPVLLVFSGPLPEAYGALTSLEHLLVSENRLEGPLPDFVGQWPHMKELWAEYNGFDVSGVLGCFALAQVSF
jgi:hypothetical protein